ncbi:tRNA pseudouridine(38-40) synthase TruA [Holospora curviuscula]|uniref:tRNA pseudouridine synthase A n=1 Tax=Holospora curviuscula TaxID=1082868 RepID=A0A2S5R7H0_9PROT|nr:tRNA pseudouridine(38-40) synthase TruA [Holospora curviuscula]PPE03286.1 tRNA pseudouridine synthase A [Holospora curviuscula]
MKSRYALKIEYDGAFFSGWQSQTSSPLSVQRRLEQAFLALTQESVHVYAAGRTDTGVHAQGQVAHVDFSRHYTQECLHKGGNYYLNHSGVQILKVQRVSEAFHARFSAERRIYRYILLPRSSSSPLWKTRAWWIKKPLQNALLEEAAVVLTGSWDFSNFRNSACQASNPFRTLEKVVVEHVEPFIYLQFQAKSFLHRQVRMMTGAMVQFATKCITLKEFLAYLSPKDSNSKPLAAPAHGLYLEKVLYNDFVF